jgi:hypothetical protein
MDHEIDEEDELFLSTTTLVRDCKRTRQQHGGYPSGSIGAAVATEPLTLSSKSTPPEFIQAVA